MAKNITEDFQELQEMVHGVQPYEHPTYQGMKWSWGHLGFLDGHEYYLRNGALYRAPVYSAFDFETGCRWGELVAKGKGVKPYIASLWDRGMVEA